MCYSCFFFFFQAEDGIRDLTVTGVQTCALPISCRSSRARQQIKGYLKRGVPSKSGRQYDQFTTLLPFESSDAWVATLREKGVKLRAREEKRSEEHTSELQSQSNLVCRLLLEKKKEK